MNRIVNSKNATRRHFRHSARLTRPVNLGLYVPRGGFRF